MLLIILTCGTDRAFIDTLYLSDRRKSNSCNDNNVSNILAKFGTIRHAAVIDTKWSIILLMTGVNSNDLLRNNIIIYKVNIRRRKNIIHPHKCIRRCYLI